MIKILKLMDENKKKNKGQPIAAIIYDKQLKPIEIESNNPNPLEAKGNGVNNDKNHAEQLSLNNLETKN